MNSEEAKSKIQQTIRKKLCADEKYSIVISEMLFENNDRQTVIMIFFKGDINNISKYIIEKPLEEITEKDIRKKIKSTLQQGCSNPTHRHALYEQKAKNVVLVNAVAVVLEIGVGYHSHSMALLADGWHMASHVLAIGLCWIAYYVARKNSENEQFKNGTGKVLALAGYTSAIILLIVALLMMVEAIQRLIYPEKIIFQEAILVAIIGLVVNAVSAKVLHHDHHHSDHNIRAAYLHVLADMLTSVTAIVSLLIGYFFGMLTFDAVIGIISSLVIIKWAVDLMKNSGMELLDYGKK